MLEIEVLYEPVPSAEEGNLEECAAVCVI